MSALDKNPENLNPLSELNYKFFIKKIPNVNYWCQGADLPDLTLPPTVQPSPLVNIPYYGDHIQYGELGVTFLVDEDMRNYFEIANWIRGLGFPEDAAEFKEIKDKNRWSGEGIFSDASLFLLTNVKNPNIEVVFHDAFPTYLSGMSVSSTAQKVKYIVATARFKFTLYDINTLPPSDGDV
jgi:hypothetical protein